MESFVKRGRSLNKPPFNDSVGEFDFRGTLYFSRALKMADIPHRAEKNAFLGCLSPLFEFANTSFMQSYRSVLRQHVCQCIV